MLLVVTTTRVPLGELDHFRHVFACSQRNYNGTPNAKSVAVTSRLILRLTAKKERKLEEEIKAAFYFSFVTLAYRCVGKQHYPSVRIILLYFISYSKRAWQQ